MRKRLVFTTALAGLLTALSFSIAVAQAPTVLITVDEQGNGTFDSPVLGHATSTGTLIADPGPGGLGSALTYNLLGPPSLIAGDVRLTEPGSRDFISDIIRFNPAGTGGGGYPASLVFYSDNKDGVDAIADTGFPSGAYTNVVTIPEFGPEGNNGAVYTPGPDQPGFIAGFAITYHFISDNEVPEPGAAALLFCAVPAVGALVVRRRKLV